MKLRYQNQKINPLNFILSVIFVIFTLYSESNARIDNLGSSTADNPENPNTIPITVPKPSTGDNNLGNKTDTKGPAASKKKPLTKRIPTDEQFKNNPGMCGRACQNLGSCQKDEELTKACWKHCPKSICVKRGKKPEGTPTEPK